VQLDSDQLRGIEKRRTFCDLGGENPPETMQEVRLDEQDNLSAPEPERRS
jgi:hypothetical protein